VLSGNLLNFVKDSWKGSEEFINVSGFWGGLKHVGVMMFIMLVVVFVVMFVMLMMLVEILDVIESGIDG